MVVEHLRGGHCRGEIQDSDGGGLRQRSLGVLDDVGDLVMSSGGSRKGSRGWTVVEGGAVALGLEWGYWENLGLGIGVCGSSETEENIL